MKMGSLLKKSLIALLPISLGLGVLLGVNKNSVQQVEGYSTSSLPTTIDLNDTSEANIRSYYSSLNNKTQSERQGTNLLKNLKTILKNGQKYYSYDSGNAIWQIYEIADRDWTKSPASSTTYGTYNSSTNKITGYTYGTGSGSSAKNNPYIHALYINRDVTNETKAWGNHNQDQWGINREHVWPKAEGFETSGAGGARGDPMHLMAGNGYANNIHSNYYYGYVKTSATYTDCGTKYSNQSGNLRGTSKTLNTGTVFEPQDCDKGDIARAIFYMVARYNYYSGSDSDGIDSNNPNLELTQSISDWSSTGYSSTTSKKGKMGILTDLLNWHHQDPVDEYEIHRNNLLYTNYTNNRNPFIDFPEWADYIWGTATYNGTTYSSYSSTPTGYATPSSDTINGYNSGGSSDPVSVTGVTLEKETTSIEVGGSEVLSYTVSPSNATNQAVTWTSSNTSVATVSSSGRVAGIAEGSTTITIKTSDGNFTDTCTVTVTAASQQQSGSATIAYSDTFSPAFPSASKDVNTSSTSHTDTTSSIAFKEQGIYKGSTNNYLMFVENKGFLYNTSSLGTIDSVSVTYTSGTSTSGKIGVYFGSNECSTYTTTSNQTIKGQSQTDTFENNVEGNGYFQISTSNKNVQITNISIEYHETSQSEVTLSSIAVKVSPDKITYTAGEDFEPAGLVITGTYSNSSTQDIPYEDNEDSFEFTPSENLQTSNTSVTISYGGKTTTQSITVNAASKTLSSISVSTGPTKTSYTQGEYFDPTGLAITRTYSDSTSDTYTYANHTSEFEFTPSTSTLLTTSDTSVTISYGGKSCNQAILVSSSGGSGGESGSQRISANTSSTYYLLGDICPTGDGNEGTASCSAFSVSWLKNNSQSAIAYTYAEIRVYASHSFTITPEVNYEITSVVITANSSSYASAVGGDSVTNCVKSVSGSTVTLTPTDGTSPVGFSNTAQSRLNYIVVNYEYNEPIEPVTYTLVTNVSSLRTGDEIIFVSYNTTNSKYYVATSVGNNMMLQSEEITCSNGVATKSDNAGLFEIVKSGNYYSFKHGTDGYLKYYTNNGSYVAGYSSSIDDYSRFTIPSVDSTSGIIEAHVVASGLSSRYFRYNYNSGNGRFLIYSVANYNGIAIYKKTTQFSADTWCQDFLDNTSNGVDTCYTTNWESLATGYNNLAANVKREIYEAEANASTDYNLRSQAMARYDYMISDPRFDVSNFISERGVSQSKPNISILLGKQTNNVIIIVTYSLIGVSAIGGYFFMKSKRKEEF